MTPTTLGLEFLAPVAGLVAGGLGALGLLALYLLKLRRQPMRVSSTLLWEQAIQDLQVNAPFRWLRASWLLLLQMLIVACLALAAARPAMDLPSQSGGRVILLIDHSASMSARDADGGSRLDEAKAAAIDVVDRLSGSAQAMVVAFAGGARTVSNFSRDRGMLRDVIRGIEPTDQPDDIGSALRVVEAFVARGDEEGESNAPPRVILLSDGGLARTGGQLTAAIGGASFEFVRVGPAPEDEKENVGIVAMSARRDFEDPSLVRVFARIASARRSVSEATVTLALDGEAVDIRRVEVPGVDEEGRLGEAPISMALTTPVGGLLTMSLAARDALSADDEAGLVLPPPRAARILLVRPDGSEAGSGLLLEEVLATLPPRSLERMGEGEYAARSAQAGFFDAFDLVVFDRVRPGEMPPVATLSFGASVPLPGLALEPTGESSSGFAFWQRSHPVMRYVALSDVRIAEPSRIVTPPDGESGFRATVLASGTGGALIVSLERGAMRRIVVSFPLGATFWWRDLSFPIFVANAVDYLTMGAGSGAGVSWTTGESVSIAAPAGVGRIRVVGPGGFEREASVGGGGLATIGVPPLCGRYEAIGLEGLGGVIPVNLFDDRESSLATTAGVEIAGRVAPARSAAGVSPREVWAWLVAAALVLLVLEWSIFAWRIRIR